MTIKLHVAQDAPSASKGVIETLRELIKRARAGEIRSIAIAYIAGDDAQYELEIETGDALTLASVCRQMDESIRASEFSGEETP